MSILAQRNPNATASFADLFRAGPACALAQALGLPFHHSNAPALQSVLEDDPEHQNEKEQGGFMGR